MASIARYAEARIVGVWYLKIAACRYIMSSGFWYKGHVVPHGIGFALEVCPYEEVPMEPMSITEVSPEQLKARLDRGDDVVVVDLRQAWEYHAGHIPGAVSLFIEEIPMRLSELPTDVDIVLQCWHGSYQSRRGSLYDPAGLARQSCCELERGHGRVGTDPRDSDVGAHVARTPPTSPCFWPLSWAVLSRGCIFPSAAVKSWSETTDMPHKEGTSPYGV